MSGNHLGIINTQKAVSVRVKDKENNDILVKKMFKTCAGGSCILSDIKDEFDAICSKKICSVPLKNANFYATEIITDIVFHVGL
jgi:hypothetical protein